MKCPHCGGKISRFEKTHGLSKNPTWRRDGRTMCGLFPIVNSEPVSRLVTENDNEIDCLACLQTMDSHLKKNLGSSAEKTPD
jgi:hypothetical protein